jgi:polysaccharide deacetylase 2 family uncharacterized protein YibQ
MPPNDLNAPLYRDTRPAPPRRRSVIAPVLISTALLVAVVAAFWIAIVDDPDGGRSVALARIVDAAPAATGSLSRDPAEATLSPAPVEASASASAREELALSGGQGAMVVAGLAEQSPFGLLPRVSPDGRRPREAYARRAPPAGPETPRIAIVVGGLGMSQTGTQKAISALPEDVTLAFASLGSSLNRWAEEARAEGHEILLQIPLEPLGYPDTNPGEHTLLVSPDRHRNRQDLEWNLGRMTAYAGVTNHMGSRFTGEDTAMLPFLGEIGERGLFYLDDGSMPQSRATAIGEALQVPVVTADLILDQERSVDAIERSLRQLESIAAERGMAVGVASAFPTSVEAIARWAGEAGARGVTIVPASAALN